MKNLCLLLSLLFGIGGMLNTAAAQDKLKIINYNVLVGMESDSTANKQLFTEWIKAQNPDIIALEEMNEFTQKSFEEFARQYGHPYAVLLKDEGYPVALSSKYPIIHVSRVIDNMHHGFIQARINDINIIVLHLSPFRYEKRNEEIDLILNTIASRSPNEKWMIMGDFNAVSHLDSEHYANGQLAKSMESNDVAYSYINNLIGGKKLDYGVHQKMLDAGFVDVVKKYHNDYISTCETKRYSSSDKEDITSRIDFIYISNNMQNQTIGSDVPKDDFTDYYSDHYPIVLEMKK